MSNCTKVSFADEKLANYYIDKLQKTSVRKKVPVKAYLCEKCFNWHLTHKEDYFILREEHEEIVKELKSKVDTLNKQVEILTKKSTEYKKLIQCLENKLIKLKNRIKNEDPNN